MMNQKGFATTEFLFAVFIAFGLTILTFALTLTLSLVEVSQYMVFAAARAQAAGHLNVAQQEQMARNKFGDLRSAKGIQELFSNGWYDISTVADLEVRPGSGSNFENEYGGTMTRNSFQGVRATFRADILEMRLPLVGPVTPENGSFSANINALLIREVSQEECQNFTEQRIPFIRENLEGGRFNRLRGATDIIPWEDNGC